MTHPLSEAGTSVEVKAERLASLRLWEKDELAAKIIALEVEIDALIQPTPAETEGGELVGRLKYLRGVLRWTDADGRPIPAAAEIDTGLREAADRIEALEAERDEARETAVRWGKSGEEQFKRAESLSRQLEEAREALKQGFMTANSDGQTGRYEVVIKFRDIGTMQAAHGALVNFARRAKETVSHG